MGTSIVPGFCRALLFKSNNNKQISRIYSFFSVDFEILTIVYFDQGAILEIIPKNLINEFLIFYNLKAFLSRISSQSIHFYREIENYQFLDGKTMISS